MKDYFIIHGVQKDLWRMHILLRATFFYISVIRCKKGAYITAGGLRHHTGLERHKQMQGHIRKGF